jgi:nucleotide-binding universal stress UspA family protein
MSYKILLLVDGSEGATHAVRHVVRLATMIKDLEVHLVNVQSRGDDWMVRRMLKSDELAVMEEEWSQSAIAPARVILQAAGIPCIDHMEQGEVGPTIARLTRDLACDQIVMGTRGQTALGGLLMGSVATKVLHLVEVPVTLVK